MLIHSQYLSVYTFVLLSALTPRRGHWTLHPQQTGLACEGRHPKTHTPHKLLDSVCVPQHHATAFVLAPGRVGAVFVLAPGRAGTEANKI